MTLETTPTAATHWSTRSLARHLGMSQSAISRIWRAFGLKPHLVDTFKLSTDPQLIDKVGDVVGLYLNPPEAAMVLCVDEKSSIQALDRTAPILPLLPGTPQRQTHDQVRHGTTNLYAALDVASGKVISQLTARHRAAEFKRFLAQVERAVPADLAVHVICDNSSTHKTPAIQRWLVAHPRVQLHFTPTDSSWLNLVERWFAELTTKWLRRGSHRSVSELEQAIQTWIEAWNEDPRPFVWTKTADEILDSLRRYLQRISDSEH
jgi:transposase